MRIFVPSRLSQLSSSSVAELGRGFDRQSFSPKALLAESLDDFRYCAVLRSTKIGTWSVFSVRGAGSIRGAGTGEFPQNSSGFSPEVGRESPKRPHFRAILVPRLDKKYFFL